MARETQARALRVISESVIIKGGWVVESIESILTLHPAPVPNQRSAGTGLDA